MFEWLSAQSPSVATFLGTLMGSSLGLVALLIGAFVNASLNRARDDRLRREEARSIISALTGELTGIRVAFGGLAEQLEKDTAPDPSWPEILVPDLTKLVRVMPTLLPKFGFLSPDTVRQVIDVYVTVEQFRPTVLLLGGKPHSNDLHTTMPRAQAGRVAQTGTQCREES
jgi:hypothetical protein